MRPECSGPRSSRHDARAPSWRDPGLYELAVDGSGTARRILDDALDAQAISLSPDGRTLSVVSGVRDFNGVDGPFQRYLVDRDGSNLRRILADLDNPFAARWSPDGRWIAFLSTEPETYTTGLYVTDPTGTIVRRLATAYESGASGGNGLAWSPQSDRIAYSTNQARAVGVHVVRLSDGAVTTVFRGGDLGGVSWSQDGTRMVGTRMPMGVVVMSASSEGGAIIDERASSAHGGRRSPTRSPPASSSWPPTAPSCARWACSGRSTGHPTAGVSSGMTCGARW